MQLQYNLFYRQFGIRRVMMLFTPRMFPMDQFNFPKSSMYHHISHDDENLAPDPNQSYFHVYRKRILMDVANMLTETEGHAKRNSIQAQNLYRPFFRQNNLFKFMHEPHKLIKDPSALTAVDYGYLQKLYRYAKFPLTAYYQWRNIEKTAWDNIRRLTEESERQHFVFFNVPDVLPGITSLRMYANKINNAILHVFDTPEKRFILELWRWIDIEARAESLFGQFTQANLDKVNLVMIHNGQWCVLNLGQFNLWRKVASAAEVQEEATTNEDSVDKSKTPVLAVAYPPVQLQKLLLKMFMSIQSQTAIVEEVPQEEKKEIPTEPEIEPDATDEVEEEDTPEIQVPPEAPTDTGEVAPSLPEVEVTETDDDYSGEITDELMASIEEDLKALEYIEQKTLMMRGVHNDTQDAGVSNSVEKKVSFTALPEEHIHLTASLFEEKSAQHALKEVIDRHAEYGLMSASDYRKTLKQAEQFMVADDPYHGNEKIGDFIKIEPHQLKLESAEIKLPDIATVPDKSMLQSSLLSFDSKYIQHVMPKDITAMAANIQRAGVIVQDYTIETDNSVLGEYEIHTLKLKPVDGANSTWRFKLPKVNSEGVFTCGGVKYRMRKQRGDRPLRKINPSTVAATSYYGKVFINRSAKKVNDATNWLARQILVLGQSGESKQILRVAPADVFDNTFKAPRIYSGLAAYFKTIDLDGYHLVFDHVEREKMLPADQLAALEGNAYRLIGSAKAGQPVFVDYNDQFFVYDKGQMSPLGSIYALTLIDQTKAPLDFAELKIYSKTIPVGIVLAYTMGLTNLIKWLKVTPRVFEPRQRVDLQADEWVMAFKDKKYVFSRKDALASLILGGFLEYWKSIKNYFVESFDQPNVYLNVLESNGIGARYLRELELLDQLFVDPITRDILKEMGEPVTFKGLIVRGSEMLMTDMHPDSQDMGAMRIKGYERFAGAIYREMTAAIRDFKSRNIRGKSQLDMNPYAVWRNITQDPSVEIVKDINPIENLKQIEAVTYVGEGGRGKDAMNKASRAFHESDVGVVSEATVDSSDVGINAYLSANPLFTSLRGLTQRFDANEHGVTSMLSTSALVSPGADHDD